MHSSGYRRLPTIIPGKARTVTVLASALVAIGLAAGPVRSAGDEPEQIGFNELWLGQPVAEVDLADYHVDEYYDPELYYSTWRSWELLDGVEEYRFDFQDLDGEVHRIVLDFLPFNEAGELITAPRGIFAQVTREFRKLYPDWEYDQWSTTPIPEMPQTLMEVREIYNDRYCISIRYSELGTTVLIGYTDELHSADETEPASVLTTDAPDVA